MVERAVEFAVGVVAGAAGCGAGCCEQPQMPTANKSDNATKKRTRTFIPRSPK
jgi:hypothetical protein